MKYLFLFIFSTSCLYKISAQGNLQFNQVLYLSSTFPSNNNIGTVPAGKVWKIESVGGGSTGFTPWFRINGVNAGYFIFNTTNAQMAFNSCRLPMWFPAGTAIGFGSNEGGSVIWFSIVEFNVVP
jgi:hypothetical protein